MSNLTVIPLIIEGIYRDIENYSKGRKVEEIEFQSRWKELYRPLQQDPDWYRAALSKLGRPLLGYLIRSKTFLSAVATDLDSSFFDILLAILQENTASLMIFSRVRLPRIKDREPQTGNELPDKFLGLQTNKDKNWYVVPSVGYSITPTFAITTEENIYDESDFHNIDPPSGWPETLPWPSHPGTRHAGNQCHICQSKNICCCTPPLPSSGEYLVEIHSYGAMGRGIRTLQSIKAGTVIAEYTGRFHHISAEIDTTYAMHFTNPLPQGTTTTTTTSIPLPHRKRSHTSEPEPDEEIEEEEAEETEAEPISLLSSHLQTNEPGSWTRFINHTCSHSNTRFVSVDIGTQKRVVVQAVRDIGLYEQLTIDYGIDYWDTRVCLCGSGEGVCYAPASASAITATADTTTQHVEGEESWLVPEDSHDEDTSCEGEEDENDGMALDANEREREREHEHEPAKNKEESEAEGEDENERYRAAAERVHNTRARKQESKSWRRRWIGQESATRPRRKGRKVAGPFYAQF